MKVNREKTGAAVGAAVVAAAGIVAAITLTDNSSPTVTEGQTLMVASHQTDPARARQLVLGGLTDMCSTTVSGKQYFSNFTAYKGAAWYRGLSKLTLAQALSQDKAVYDQAGNEHLMLTTVSGSKYCANKTRYVGGHWERAFSILSNEANTLSGQSATPPTIAVK